MFKEQKIAINCPHCGNTYHGIELTFPIENDRGHWIVDCIGCNKEFVVEINNPRESGGSIKSHVKASLEAPFTGNQAMLAKEIAKHNLEHNRHEIQYNYAATPLYECEKSGANLEVIAQQILSNEFGSIKNEYFSAQNYLLSSRGDHEIAVVRLNVTCQCGEQHVATFYTQMIMRSGEGLEDEGKLILGNVSGSKLSETLTGLFSKTEFMHLLEKLIARWNLIFDQVIVVSPFIGYTQMSSDKKLDIWEKMLMIMNPERSAFLTRTSTWNDYKKAMQASGIPLELLERFDLQNKLVEMRNSKQDFHAKFYAGVSDDECELLSGSANLVSGPSIENLAFHKISKHYFDNRYLNKLNLKKPLPTASPKANNWVLIEKNGNGWVSKEGSGKNYL